MNQLYICKISEHQASGNQIDIPKAIAKEFFGASDDVISGSKKMEINVCHTNDVKSFTQIEIQPATNPRFSTRLNAFLNENGSPLAGDDLLVIEKIGRSYCVRVIKQADKKYAPLTELFEEDEKHMLLSATLNMTPDNPKRASNTLRPYLAAIKSKPFLLLAGISGTGKSRIVRELARACWEYNSEQYKAHKPRNFEIIQVRPNWHDSSDLIGYVSRISGEPIYVVGDFLKFVVQAWQEPNIPYFLCLDEMNLAPVEQYFAEYLSVIESREWNKDIQKVITDPILKNEIENERDKNNNLVPKKWYKKLIDELLAKCPDENKFELYNQFIENGISLPQNLVVVGTVNMDETTYAFSRKVLDRAMTIEMNEVDLFGGLTEEDYHVQLIASPKSIIPTAVEGKDIYSQNKDICDVVIKNLQLINEQLEGTPFKIAYRTRNEFLLYVVNSCDMGGSEAQAFDEIVCMKILPRIEGDQKKVGKVLDNLQTVLKNIFNIDDNRQETNEHVENSADKAKPSFSSQSIKKLEEMKKRLNDQYYCSFWN